MRPADRQVTWAFLAAFVAAVIAQGVGAKLVIRLVNGTLSAAALPGVAVLVGAYGLLVVALARMVSRWAR